MIKFNLLKKRAFVVIIAVSIGLLVTNMSVRINPFEGGGCVSVSFDKFLMFLADRAVIRYGEFSCEITDAELIDQISSETRCATHTDLRYPQTDRWIELYIGNTMIRKMRWENNHNGIIVYNADVYHWIFPSMSGEGIIYPSEELIEMLNTTLNTD